MSVIYCAKASVQEVERAPTERKWYVRRKKTLGLVPVVDGKCSCCGRSVRTLA